MTEQITITYDPDVAAARRQVKAFALTQGFDEIASEEVAITVSELATNLLKHAGGGQLLLTPLGEKTRPGDLPLASPTGAGLQIEAIDQGPGIRDIERAFTDGFSTVGSLGYGLGTVNRLMDQVTVESEPGHGAHITCIRHVRAPRTSCVMPAMPFTLDIGAASRAYPGLDDNGDAFVVKRWEQGTLVGVIDGVGHGQFAARASRSARQYIEAHYDLSLNALFLGASRACHATRGVVMALARFDYLPHAVPPAPVMTLTFASVGNIESRVIGGPAHTSLLVKRGMIGITNAMPRVQVCVYPWSADQLLILHSDGLHTHWRWEDLAVTAADSADGIARHLLTKLARDDDDATAVIVKGISHS